MKRLTIYIDHIVYADGIFTWICNFYQLMHKVYDIEGMTNVIKPELNDIFERYGIPVVKWNANVNYDTDILMLMLDFVVYPTNFTFWKKYKIVHCNYNQNILYYKENLVVLLLLLHEMKNINMIFHFLNIFV